ncbi:hypothetical protein LOTGIDRAFT_206748 [Lottia gigantea]|uniref:Sulfatase N-terminal domain-containing protein n=1 Tax=Lottia gigantea TaxID=225164 RepID=V4A0C5_LOTGI|nr:hypothetical protein LOTGIDRAFT_206748 [Lottia gigantea]ESO90112.1 hypothetical protein LOTGIDRAFT_206748 [Lottia gigantea]
MFYKVVILLLYQSLLTLAAPNIIFIVADDLGWDDVSFHGSEQIPTPNIDALATNGIILNNYYVSPICTPTRSAIMTGRHPIHTGMQHSVIVGDQPYGLPLNESIMPQFFSTLGYESHIVGKWHLGFFAQEYTPLFRGFQTHLGYWLGAEDYFDHTAEAETVPYKNQYGLDFRDNMTVLSTENGTYSTELFTKQAVTIIQNQDHSKPLFLYLPYQAVHSGNLDEEPLQAPLEYIDRFPHIQNKNRRTFAGMVSALDDAVGAIVDALSEEGMLSNSIIVFTTDNGGPSNGFDGNAASNYPLRGLKATLWEGGVRGNGLIYSPLLQTQRYVSQQMMHVTDWLPTLFRAAGGDPNGLRNMDGFDMWDMLSYNDDHSPRTDILHNIDPIEQKAAIRVNDYKLLTGNIDMRYDGWYPPYQLEEDTEKIYNDRQNVVNMKVPHTTVKVQCGQKPANASTNCDPKVYPCLYHIPSDPCEYNNIAASNHDLVLELLQRLQDYSKGMVPPGNKPFDPKGDPKYHNNTWVPWVK